MKPYYEHDGITIYHGDCRDVINDIEYETIIGDAPYGVGMSYGAFSDTPERVLELSNSLRPYLESAQSSGLFVGVPQQWYWPKPKWVLCWAYDPSTNDFSPWGFAQWQPLLVYGKDPFLAARLGPRPTVFRHARPPNKKGNLHPCPKPLPVMKWAVERVAADGAMILDPFMGSGTTLRAAKDLGRKAIGIEIEERYCEIAAKRLAQGVLDFGGAQ